MTKHFTLPLEPAAVAQPGRRRGLLSISTIAAALFLLVSASVPTVYAAETISADAGYIKTSGRKHSSHRVRIKESRSSSDETPAQRDKRLYRECQGRPNSGACLGYAYPPRR